MTYIYDTDLCFSHEWYYITFKPNSELIFLSLPALPFNFKNQIVLKHYKYKKGTQRSLRRCGSESRCLHGSAFPTVLFSLNISLLFQGNSEHSFFVFGIDKLIFFIYSLIILIIIAISSIYQFLQHFVFFLFTFCLDNSYENGGYLDIIRTHSHGKTKARSGSFSD